VLRYTGKVRNCVYIFRVIPHFCVALSKKRQHIWIVLSVCLSVHSSVRPSRKLTLAITLLFLNISSSNFQIILLRTTRSQWSHIFKVKVTFNRVMPLFILGFWHANLTLAISLLFLNISSSNFQIILLRTTRSQWSHILQVKVTFNRVMLLFVLGFWHKILTLAITLPLLNISFSNF
jgi:hypothetical protein